MRHDKTEALYVGVASDGICNFLGTVGVVVVRPAAFEASVLRILHDRQRQLGGGRRPPLCSPHLVLRGRPSVSGLRASPSGIVLLPPQISGLFDPTLRRASSRRRVSTGTRGGDLGAGHRGTRKAGIALSRMKIIGD